MCQRLGTSLDLKPEVDRKDARLRLAIHDRMRDLRTASREVVSRFF